MNESLKIYYQLNKPNLIYQSGIYAIAFALISLLCSAVVIYFYALDILLVALIALLATIILTAFLVLQNLVTGNHEFQRRRRIYHIPYLREFFKQNQFVLIVNKPASKMNMTEELMIGRIGNYTLECDIDEDEPLLVNFKFKTQQIALTKEQLNRMLGLLKEYQAKFTPDGIILKVTLSKFLTASMLQGKIETIANTLAIENVLPLK